VCPGGALPGRRTHVRVPRASNRVHWEQRVTVRAEVLGAPGAVDLGAAILLTGIGDATDHRVADRAVVVALRPCKRALGGCGAVLLRAHHRLARVLGLGLAAQAARLNARGVGVAPGACKGVKVRCGLLVERADAGHAGCRLLEDERRLVVDALLGRASEHPERAVPAGSLRD